MLATALESELHVISAFDPQESQMPQVRHGSSSSAEVTATVRKRKGILQRYEEHAQGTARMVADKLRAKYPELEVVEKAVEGAPAATLISEADELAGDVVVVGNKRVQGAARILGSIATAVAREINCDLYVANTRPR